MLKTVTYSTLKEMRKATQSVYISFLKLSWTVIDKYQILKVKALVAIVQIRKIRQEASENWLNRSLLAPFFKRKEVA